MNRQPSDKEVRSALESMILSASGWRKVFAPGGDHDSSKEPDTADQLLAVGMGMVWGQWLERRLGKRDSVVLVATDTRPTGPNIAELMVCGLKYSGCQVRYIGIAAAPEAMARTGNDNEIDAFAYISASHNPLGHNGVKFGLGGGVIAGTDAKDLIAKYHALIEEPGAADRLNVLRESQVPAIPDPEEKRQSLVAYEKFLNHIAGGPGDDSSRSETLSALQRSLRSRPVTIIADLNGSARCLSSDRPYLERLGAKLLTFNDTAGEIAHVVVRAQEERAARLVEQIEVEDVGLAETHPVLGVEFLGYRCNDACPIRFVDDLDRKLLVGAEVAEELFEQISSEFAEADDRCSPDSLAIGAVEVAIDDAPGGDVVGVEEAYPQRSG